MEGTPKSKEDNPTAATPASMASTESRPYDEVVDESKTSATPKRLMLLAPTTRTSSPTRGRTLLTDEKEGGKPIGRKSNDDLEEGREAFPDKVSSTPIGMSVSAVPVEDEDKDESSTTGKVKRRKLLWCVFGFALFLGTGAGLLGYFYFLKSGDESEKLTKEFISPARFTKPPTDSPTLSPTQADLPSNSPTLSAEPTQTFLPSGSPSTPLPSGSPSTPLPSQPPSESPTSSPEPTPSPSAAPTLDFLVVLEGFLFGKYGVNVDRLEDGELTNNALAIDWLVGENKAEAIDVLDEKLAQRFALVAMDLALQGAKNADDAPRNAQRTVDHCEWKGIKCNDDGFVREVHWDYQQKGRNGSGTIAPEARLLVRSLKVLDLSNNDLVGKIPESLYRLTNLEKLYLFKNQLEGTISSNLGELDSITHFQLSHNKLSGMIPVQAQSGDSGIRPLGKRVISTSSLGRYFVTVRN